jgi:hypothetical protein
VINHCLLLLSGRQSSGRKEYLFPDIRGVKAVSDVRVINNLVFFCLNERRIDRIASSFVYRAVFWTGR